MVASVTFAVIVLALCISLSSSFISPSLITPRPLPVRPPNK